MYTEATMYIMWRYITDHIYFSPEISNVRYSKLDYTQSQTDLNKLSTIVNIASSRRNVPPEDYVIRGWRKHRYRFIFLH